MIENSLFAFFLSFLSIVGLQEFHPQLETTQGIVFSFNEGFPSFSADSLKLMSFGYSRIMSNLLWLRFLQHTPPIKIEKDQVSWMYLDLDAISTLDPDFMPVFNQAAIFLSVVTEDKKGAELLLQKGTRLYPNLWQLHSYLAYHYQHELKDYARAKAEYEAAAKSPGAPPLMGLLAARYMSGQEGEYASVEFLKQLRDASNDPDVRAKFEHKILDLMSKYDGPNRFKH